MKLEKGTNNLQKCKVCGKQILQDIERISFEYKTKFGRNYIRICALCILKLAEQLDKKSVKKYEALKKIKKTIERKAFYVERIKDGEDEDIKNLSNPSGDTNDLCESN